MDGFAEFLKKQGMSSEQIDAAYADAGVGERVEVYCEQHSAWEPEWTDCDGAATQIRVR